MTCHGLLGFAFMLAGPVTTLLHFTVRSIDQRKLGGDALGQFQRG